MDKLWFRLQSYLMKMSLKKKHWSKFYVKQKKVTLQVLWAYTYMETYYLSVDYLQ